MPLILLIIYVKSVDFNLWTTLFCRLNLWIALFVRSYLTNLLIFKNNEFYEIILKFKTKIQRSYVFYLFTIYVKSIDFNLWTTPFCRLNLWIAPLSSCTCPSQSYQDILQKKWPSHFWFLFQGLGSRASK